MISYQLSVISYQWSVIGQQVKGDLGSVGGWTICPLIIAADLLVSDV